MVNCKNSIDTAIMILESEAVMKRILECFSPLDLTKLQVVSRLFYDKAIGRAQTCVQLHQAPIFFFKPGMPWYITVLRITPFYKIEAEEFNIKTVFFDYST